MQAIPRPSLDLSYLYEQCIFRSQTCEQSQEVPSRELSEHRLRWGGKQVDTAMYKAIGEDVQLYALRYGARVEVRPQPFPHNVMVHTALKGSIEVLADGYRMTIPEGRSAWIAPRADVRLWWNDDAEHLLVKVPRAHIDQWLSGKDQLMPARLLPESGQHHWSALVQGLLSAIAMPASITEKASWIRHSEHLICTYLQSQEAASKADALPCPDESTAKATRASGLDVLDAMETYALSRLCAPIAIADLANAAGVSTRVLQTLCQRYHGVTPMEHLRNLRLDAIRRRLMRDGQSNVTHLAMEFGFGHPGRFADYYRKRFGVLPRETLSSAR